MLKFVLRRLLQLVPVLLAAVTLTFFMIRFAPGGPFSDEKAIPEVALEQIRDYYGLNDPLHVQYLNYLGNLVRGDLGLSLHYHTRTVNEIIATTFPVSLELGCYAMLFALLIGLAAGIVASLRRNTVLDHVPMGLAMTGICLPTFVMGPLLILAFGLGLGWVNASGWETASDRVLPAITLGAAFAAAIARLSRGSMLEVLSMEYITTARAKGLTEIRLVLGHALKNALIPVVSYLGPATAAIITGSFVVETVFQIPGMGTMFVLSAVNRDYFLLLGLVAFYATVLVLINLAADIALCWLNPKMRIKA